MRTKEEIKKMLDASIVSDGLVSPSAIEALEWVLEIESEYDVFRMVRKND